MEHKDEVQFYEFECHAEPCPPGTPAPPRPAHRPRRITREILPEAPIGIELEQFVIAALESAAVRKMAEQRKADIGFSDACGFWGVTENMRRDQLDEQLSSIAKNLTEVHRNCPGTSLLPKSGRTLTVEEIRLLWSTFFYMEERFKRHLDLMRGRQQGY